MKIRAEEITSVIRREIETYRSTLDVSETGTVLEVGDGIARIHGLTNAMAGEMLEFENGIFAQVMNLEEDSIGAVILGNYLDITEGMRVKSTKRLLSVPVGDALIGRVVDPLGQPIDGLGPIKASATRPLEIIAPGIADRRRQLRLRIALRDIGANCGGLSQRGVTILQCRHLAHRIDREIVGRALRSGGNVGQHALIGLPGLLHQPERRERARARRPVEFHHWTASFFHR